MASGHITSWQIEGERVEAVTDFIFLGSKITAGYDCSHETERCLLLGRKAMTNLDSILKSRNITLLTKVHIVKVMVFPLVMYGCESWIIKKLNAKELMMPSDHLILYCPFLLLPPIFSSVRVLSSELALCIRWPKYWSSTSASVLTVNIQD